MKVCIRDIPAEGLHLDIKEDGNELQAIAGKVDFSLLSPVSADLTILKAGEELFIKGDLTVVVRLKCARCLTEFEYSIRTGIENIYTLASQHHAKERELTSEELDINYLKGDEIDINEVLFEHLALQIPMQPVCRDDCKGLCRRCGVDLNKGKCDCPSEVHADERFAKLKEIKFK